MGIGRDLSTMGASTCTLKRITLSALKMRWRAVIHCVNGYKCIIYQTVLYILCGKCVRLAWCTKLIGGFCFGLRVLETPISLASKKLWEEKNKIVALELTILMSNFKFLGFYESSDFCSVEWGQVVFCTLSQMGNLHRYPYLKTRKFAPVGKVVLVRMTLNR